MLPSPIFHAVKADSATETAVIHSDWLGDDGIFIWVV